jgi:hypothetical protein
MNDAECPKIPRAGTFYLAKDDPLAAQIAGKFLSLRVTAFAYARHHWQPLRQFLA